MKDQKGRVLVIAGSDSGGGAGIQADIKAVMANGGYATTAVTAVTVQNTKGVFDAHHIPTATVRAQIRVILDDIGTDVIKTGMLGSRDLIEMVADTLSQFAPLAPVVVDPVMVATSGDRLLPDDAAGLIRSVMTPMAALITPNAPEAYLLTGKDVEDVSGQRRAAEALLEQGAKAALVKGGHVDGSVVVDVLQTHHAEYLFESPRIQSQNTHGTGCTLASAIGALLAQGVPMAEAVDRAREYLMEAIRTAPGLGRGYGPVNHGWPIKRSPD